MFVLPSTKNLLATRSKLYGYFNYCRFYKSDFVTVEGEIGCNIYVLIEGSCILMKKVKESNTVKGTFRELF